VHASHATWEAFLLQRGRHQLPVLEYNNKFKFSSEFIYRLYRFPPYNFKGRLDDYPDTMEYGKKMDLLRTELREYFWDGEFHHECGATVTTADGHPYRPYAVYLNRDNGSYGLVIANYSEKDSVTVQVKLEDDNGLSSYRLVDQPEWKSAKDGIEIPPYSAAVVINK
jgi:hypothetical protein